MFVKLHHRDVVSLIQLIEDLLGQGDTLNSEEQHAYDQLKLMRLAMEQRLARQVTTNEEK